MGLSIGKLSNSAAPNAAPEKRRPRKAQLTHAKAKIVTVSLDQPGRLRVGHLLTLLGISHTTLYLGMKSGRYPKPDGHDQKIPVLENDHDPGVFEGLMQSISPTTENHMSTKVMKLIDPSTGEMACRVCGRVHFANVRSGGKFYRGSWQCPEGCKLPAGSSPVKQLAAQEAA